MPVVLMPRPITVRPAPPLEPPYDDEIPPGGRLDLTLQPMLPLDWSTSRLARIAVPPADPAPARVRPAPTAARGAAMHFLSRCLEVLNGFRPVWHLRPLTAPARFTGIADQLTAALERVPPGTRVRLLGLRVCEPRPDVAEAAAVLGDDDRSWAMAVRLERRPAGWLCTLVQVVTRHPDPAQTPGAP